MVELTPKVNHPFWWLTLPHVVVDFALLVVDFALLVVDFAPDPYFAPDPNPIEQPSDEDDAELPDDEDSTDSEDSSDSGDSENSTRRPASKKDRIISYKNYDPRKDPEGYSYAMLLLFLPWIKEIDVLRKDDGELFESAEEALKFRSPQISSWLRMNDALDMLGRDFRAAVDTIHTRTLFESGEETSDAPSHANVATFEPISDAVQAILLGGGTLVDFVAQADMDAHATAENRDEVDEAVAPEEISLQSIMKDLKRNEKQCVFVQRVWEWGKEKISELKANGPAAPRLHLFLSGGGGTGKSFCIGALQKILTAMFRGISAIPLLTCAPTGNASLLVSGATLHSTFFLPVSHDRTGQPPQLYELGKKALERLQALLVGISVLIIDEIIMVSRRTFQHISHRICTAKNNFEVPFGGLAVIVCGDLFQLEPVGKHETEAFTSHLWKDFQLYELMVNERCPDVLWSDMLTRMREHHPNFPKLTDSDIALLNACCLRGATSNKKAIHLFCVNKAVNTHNAAMFDEAKRACTGRSVTLYSADVSVRGSSRQTSSHVAQTNVHHSETGGVPTSLDICVGTRVLLTRNIDKPQRLVSGQCGSVLGWEQGQGRGNTHTITTVYVHWDDPSAGMDRKKASCIHGLVAVPIIAEHTEYDTTKGAKIRRTGFPLVHAYGVSIHKSQGMSLSLACASFEGLFAKAQAYVAASRVKSRTGFSVIAESFPVEAVSCSLSALKEMERLREGLPFVRRGGRSDAETQPVASVMEDEIMGAMRAHDLLLRQNRREEDADPRDMDPEEMEAVDVDPWSVFD